MNYNQSYAQQLVSLTQNIQRRTGVKPLIGRVVHVVQGPFYFGTNVRDPYYNDPTDLNTIVYQVISDVQDSELDGYGNPTAKPRYGSLSHIPLVGELVQLELGPSVNMNESREAKEIYYSIPYNLWNATHHNAFPDMGTYGEFVNEITRNYQDVTTTKQAINTTATGSLTFPLGPNFPEKPNIKNLKLFTGDIALEGRWGNSIRFGSTTAGDPNANYWSRNSTPGNPITIIRNGQGRQVDSVGYIPTIENINTDPSSIYLTNGQEIVINDIKNFSLASLSVVVESADIVSIPIQQQLTSTNNISAREQDNISRQITNPNSTTPV